MSRCFRLPKLLSAALIFPWLFAQPAFSDEWTRNDARDEIVRNYGVVRPIIGKDDSLSYAIDLAPDLDDATLLAPFAPIAELILSEENAEDALKTVKGIDSLRSLSLDHPNEEVLKGAADFKNLRTLWIAGPDDEVLTSFDALKGAKKLQWLGIEGYTITAASIEPLAQSPELSGLTLASELRGDVLKPLAALKKLTNLEIEDTAGEPVDLASLGQLQNLRSLTLFLAPEEPLDAKGFEAIASLPKLERLDLSATPWKEDDLLKLKASRSLRVIACDSSLDAEAAARLTKAFGEVRFIPYGPVRNPLADLQTPKATVFSLEYDEFEEDATPPLRDPAKKYIGDGQVAAEGSIASADTIAKLHKILSDRETFQNAESVDCYSPDRGIRLTAGDITVEILFCEECKFVELREIKPSTGLIPQPGESVRYTHSLSDEAARDLKSTVDTLLGERVPRAPDDCLPLASNHSATTCWIARSHGGAKIE